MPLYFLISPMQKMKTLSLKPGKETSLQRFHPWVFSGAIKNDLKEFEEGETVNVCDSKGNSLGIGHFQKASIAVRILNFESVEITTEFWEKRIKDALLYRKQLGLTENKNTNCYRLVFGEGDLLPGLIVDYYNRNIVIQCHSAGMFKNRELIAEAIKSAYSNELECIYDKSKESLHKISGIEIQNNYLFGTNSETIVKENGHQFKVNWETGQKTGFFIDQRENRKILGEFSNGKKVLNTFSYTGGFSVYAGMGKAELVHSVDVSKSAIEICKENCTLNNLDNTESIALDTFDFLKDKKDFYDCIILDPPAFAKSRDARHQAFKGYKRLNKLAFEQIKKGGFLFTFSCSQVVDKYMFASTVMAAAIESKRKVRIVQQLCQPGDHPINVYHPEGEYLKGLILYVE